MDIIAIGVVRKTGTPQADAASGSEIQHAVAPGQRIAQALDPRLAFGQWNIHCNRKRIAGWTAPQSHADLMPTRAQPWGKLEIRLPDIAADVRDMDRPYAVAADLRLNILDGKRLNATRLLPGAEEAERT